MKQKFNDLDWLSKIFEDTKKSEIKEKKNQITSLSTEAEDYASDTSVDLVTSWDLPVDFENSFSSQHSLSIKIAKEFLTW